VARAPTEIRSYARAHALEAIQTLAGVARNGKQEAARVAAAIALLDRGWGRPPQTHTGEDGEGDIRVTIRHIVQAALAPPLTIENNGRDNDAT
jgi:hypothetical protein